MAHTTATKGHTPEDITSSHGEYMTKVCPFRDDPRTGMIQDGTFSDRLLSLSNNACDIHPSCHKEQQLMTFFIAKQLSVV